MFSSVPESKLKLAEGRYQSDFKKVVRLIAPPEYDMIDNCHRARKKVGDKLRLLIVTMATPELAQILHCYGSGRKFVYGMELRYGATLIPSKLTGLLISTQESSNGRDVKRSTRRRKVMVSPK